MTNLRGERLDINQARAESRILKEHLLNPAYRKLILKLISRYYHADEQARKAIRQNVEKGLDKLIDSNSILYSLLMETITEIIDEHSDENVIKILRDQPEHPWWYSLIDSVMDAERVSNLSNWEMYRNQYAKMSAEVFELVLLSSEAKFQIFDLIGFEEGETLISRLHTIRQELDSIIPIINTNAELLDQLDGISLFDLAVAKLRAALKKEGQEVPVKVFSYLEQLVVADERISILRTEEGK